MTPNKAAGRRAYQGFKVKHYQQKVPRVIALLDEKMEAAIDNRAAWPKLWEPLPGHVRHSYRQRRIANVQNLCCTSRCTDLESGRVGYPVTGFDKVRRIRPYTNTQLTSRSDLGLRRMQRSNGDLRARGFMRPGGVKARSKKTDDGSHHGFPAARHFNLDLYYEFGLGPQLEAAIAADAKPVINTGPAAPGPKPAATGDGPSPEAIARAIAANAATLAKVNDTS